MTSYRHITPVSRRAATGTVAAVYRQSASEVGQTILQLASPAPDVLAATWALLRESLLVGRAPRAEKELVAIGVSLANRCPFCVEAHTAFTHAAGEHALAEVVRAGGTPDDPRMAALLAWAKATRTPGAPELADPPFPKELAPEYVGTALAFHFINRMISALGDDSLLPGHAERSKTVRRLAGAMLARTMRKTRQPGASIGLLDLIRVSNPPGWAAGTPIGTAYAALRVAAGSGGMLLTGAGTAALRDAMRHWDGAHPPMAGAWVDDLLSEVPDSDRPGTRLALLAALAPYRITDAEVAAFRGTDASLVRVLAFGSMAAVEHAERSTTTALIGR
ncbi:carboxymuconolactone decarboxylase family protein [Streptosporangiaceae bacterium NEAU-GS5]|nr:carboxymuconolactone decarboxylase family protein [Streptosporangiaceae bacterium NEAU-GS5]